MTNIFNLQAAQMTEGFNDLTCPDKAERFFYPDGQFYDDRQAEMLSLADEDRPDDVDTLTVLGRWPWGPCYAVAAKDQYVFIGNGPLLQILDMTDPSTPVIVKEYLQDWVVSEILVRDSTAYVISGQKLKIFDIQNQLDWVFLGETTLGGAPQRLAVEDDLAFVSTASGVFYIVDISEPTLPYIRNITFGDENAHCLAAKGPCAYVGAFNRIGLLLIDASNPDSLTYSEVPSYGRGLSACVKDTLLFVGAWSFFNLQIFSVSNPRLPIYLAGLTLGVEIRSITTDGEYVYAATPEGEIHAVDISDPSDPFAVDNITLPWNTYQWGGDAIVKFDDNLYVASTAGLWSVGVAQSDSLQHQSFFPTCNAAGDMAVKDQTAIVDCDISGVWILDISNPTTPHQLANINIGIGNVNISENIVFLPNSEGVLMIDITDPSDPTIISEYPTDHFSWETVKENNWLYVTHWADSQNDMILEIVDISDVSDPIQLGVFHGGFDPLHIAVKDSVAYIASYSGLKIFDCHNPSAILQVSQPFTHAIGVAICDSFLYVDKADSFHVLKIVDPFFPTILGGWDRTYGSHSIIDLFPYGDYVLWAEGNMGVINIADPYHPQETAVFPRRDWSRGVTASGDAILVSDGSNGIWFLQNDFTSAIEEVKLEISESSLILFQNHPNPFNTNTTIEFFLAKSSYVNLNVYNITGQKIATLFDDWLNADQHQVTFEVSDLPSGVYYFQLNSNNQRITKKMVVIR